MEEATIWMGQAHHGFQTGPAKGQAPTGWQPIEQGSRGTMVSGGAGPLNRWLVGGEGVGVASRAT
jgi:hypothetical protein